MKVEIFEYINVLTQMSYFFLFYSLALSSLSLFGKLMWLIMMQIVLDGCVDETGEYRLNGKCLQSLHLLHNLTSGPVSVVVGATKHQNIVLK